MRAEVGPLRPHHDQATQGEPHRTVEPCLPPFLATYESHSESAVEGTAEYKETVSELQKTLSSFTLSRTRAIHPAIDKQLTTVNQIPIFVGLSNRQRKMYDDFLAKPEHRMS